MYIFPKTNIFIFLAFIIISSSCSTTTYLSKREKAFGTAGTNGWNFHRLADRDKGVTLAFPGFIVGIEKARWRKIGAPSGKEIREGAFELLGYSPEVAKWKGGKLSYQEREIMDDLKPTFVSTIVEYALDDAVIPHFHQKSIYNAYSKKDLPIATDAYYQGYEALDQFGDLLIHRIKEQNITHVFMMSMGWNSDQQESIRNFNSLMIKLFDQAINESNFRPLFIGFTWPSFWSTGGYNLFSFFNKSNDADEIGMAAFNLLLNKKLLNKKNNLDFQTVVLGHSFGAKLTSRAVMSASLLDDSTRRVDLLINLQSAYTINRYSPVRGAEKTEDFEEWNKYAKYIALVWSKHDSAVKAGFFAPFAGSAKAGRRLANPRSRDKYPTIDPISYDKNAPINFDQPSQTLLIDASNIIKTSAYEKGGAAHSDIYNEEVSQLLWKLIKAATF